MSNEPRSSKKFSWTFIKTLVVEPFSPDGQKGPFTRSKEPWSRSQLALTAKTGHFQGQTRLRAEFTIFYGDSKFRCHFWEKISWTFFMTLVMETIGHDGRNDPFSRSNESQSSKLPHFAYFCVL
ncbi:hypothetical protein H5410_053007 [Solanum commersonii]|uniref:Uncharacterized protein n=1 Tax=Solanum commersonii TaxID=4109 RepID=A0A9J5X516_SOLCO|nr:hypothetical protein H5410_053007 [Solanum commersonii]